ncbi:hypothetical protein GCM10019059_24180 [Camelimonas fluminis]|nr:hypothetical protein GCM10019059_24180 [Camelimonas fluminis]
MRRIGGFLAFAASAGFITGACAWEYRISTSDWIKSVSQSHRQVMQAVRTGDADTLKQEGYTLTRLVAEVRTWPQTEGPWTVARVRCGLAAQSLANFTDDMRRGGQRGTAAADGSLRDYNSYMADCRSWARKIK